MREQKNRYAIFISCKAKKKEIIVLDKKERSDLVQGEQIMSIVLI
jgi:hypothetical protein